MNWYFTGLHLLMLALFVYIAVDATRTYLGAEGTVSQRILAAGKGSLTVVWQRLVMLAGSGIDTAVWVAELLNAPTVAGAMQAYVKPEVMAGVMVAVAVISELARRRTLNK